MKILEIIYSFHSCGSVHFTVDLCNQLVTDGHDVTILSVCKPNSESPYVNEIVPTCKIDTLDRKYFNIGTIIAMYKKIKQTNADIVHINSIPTTAVALLAMLIQRRSKYVVTCHNQCQGEDITRYAKHFLLRKIAFRTKLHKYIAISPANDKSIYDVYGKHATKTIYNGRTFTHTTAKLEKVQKEINSLKNSDQTIVFTILARCDKQKNIPRLIRCFNEVKKRGADIILLIIGPDYENEIGITAQTDAMQHIHFLGAHTNVADYLEASDFFTLSSDFEGMPLSLLEALSHNCIPVSTPVSGVTDIIKDGVTGFIAKNFTDEAYINSIERAIADKDKIDKEALKKIYENKFTMERCAKEYEEFFKSIL